jgi:hypothetical protein
LDDRIELFYRSESTLTDALEKYKEYIQQETLAVKIAVGDPPPGAVSKELEIDNLKADLSIIKI